MPCNVTPLPCDLTPSYAGLFVDGGLSYWLIYVAELGVTGAACANIAVKVARIAVWVVVVLWFGEAGKIFKRSSERLLERNEMLLFWQLGAPSVATNFTSWFIFELQVGLRNAYRLYMYNASTAPCLSASTPTSLPHSAPLCVAVNRADKHQTYPR